MHILNSKNDHMICWPILETHADVFNLWHTSPDITGVTQKGVAFSHALIKNPPSLINKRILGLGCKYILFSKINICNMLN